jgi:hypothetical protein
VTARFSDATNFSAGKAADMPRKPNYNFERQERDRLKALETARKREAKRLKREAGDTSPDTDQDQPAED